MSSNLDFKFFSFFKMFHTHSQNVYPFKPSWYILRNLCKRLVILLLTFSHNFAKREVIVPSFFDAKMDLLELSSFWGLVLFEIKYLFIINWKGGLVDFSMDMVSLSCYLWAIKNSDFNMIKMEKWMLMEFIYLLIKGLLKLYFGYSEL